MKNILVTGSCGFMGSHFVEQLYNNYKFNVVILDKMTYAGNIKNVRNVDFEKILYVGIEDPTIIDIMKYHKIDTVVNFAAQTHVDRSITNPMDFVKTDVLGVFNLAYCSLKLGIERFIHISTDEVYGDSYSGEADESFPMIPNSPYAASKAAADLLLLSYYKTYNLPLIIVRPSNNMGERQYPEKLVPFNILRFLRGEKMFLHGEGNEKREWIYVQDCCNGIMKVLNGGIVGQIYNVGSGIRCTNKYMLMLLLKELTGEDNIELWSSYIEQVFNRPGNDRQYAINSSKIKEELDFAPITNLKGSIQKTIKWYKENPNWWSEVDISSNIYTDNKNYLR